MVIDLVIVTVPYGPGSSTLISPSRAVFAIAPANVLQGSERVHRGLESSPSPETQVRVAVCACAGAADSMRATAPRPVSLFMSILPLVCREPRDLQAAIAAPGACARTDFVWPYRTTGQFWGGPGHF